MNDGSRTLEFSDELIQISIETKRLINRYNLLLERLVASKWTNNMQKSFTSRASDVLRGMNSLADMCQDYGNSLVKYNEIEF